MAAIDKRRAVEAGWSGESRPYEASLWKWVRQLLEAARSSFFGRRESCLQACVCSKCMSMLSPVMDRVDSDVIRKWTCPTCRTGDFIEIISIPYVFRYLVAELAAMNIDVKLHARQVTDGTGASSRAGPCCAQVPSLVALPK
ncbi:DNA-directed RNA polymerase I subunit RPA2 homolog [Haemaphysalis longicornis]